VGTKFSRILVAHDGSEGAKRSLQVALDLARTFDAELHAVAVEPHLPHYRATVGEVKEELQLEETEAARVLGEAREMADQAGVALKTEVVAATRPRRSWRPPSETRSTSSCSGLPAARVFGDSYQGQPRRR